MNKEVVLDLETQKIFSEVSQNNPRLLGISVVGIYRRETKTYEKFWEGELDRLWPILEGADLTIGFNIRKFDFPVLSAYYPGDLTKLPVLDILESVKESLGFRIGLDNLARATLGLQKTADGLAAIEFYRQGEMDKLAEYCLNDVKITKEIYDYAVKNGSLKYYDLREVREFRVKLDDDNPKNEIQMSLGV